MIQSRRLFLGELSGYRELTRIRRLLGESKPAAAPLPEPCWPPPSQALPLRVVADSGRGPIRRFQLQPASLTAVVGPSGAGKSTLLDAFCGLLVGPSSEWRFHGRDGQILRWGADGAEAWRSGLAYAPQETVLFEGTLRDNLLLGRDGCDDGEILTWFVALGLEALLERPGGLDLSLIHI